MKNTREWCLRLVKMTLDWLSLLKRWRLDMKGSSIIQMLWLIINNQRKGCQICLDEWLDGNTEERDGYWVCFKRESCWYCCLLCYLYWYWTNPSFRLIIYHRSPWTNAFPVAPFLGSIQPSNIHSSWILTTHNVEVHQHLLISKMTTVAHRLLTLDKNTTMDVPTTHPLNKHHYWQAPYLSQIVS